MSYLFFQQTLTVIGYRLRYEGYSNYAGNSFCERSDEMIESYNPINILSGADKKKQNQGVLTMLEGPGVKTMKKTSGKRKSIVDQIRGGGNDGEN